VNKCCVPQCRSNYDIKAGERSISAFTFPTEKHSRATWLRKIPRENLKVTKHTVVCIKHFHDSDIIRNDLLPGKDGKPDILIPRNKPALRKDAVPCIFPNLPSYLSMSTDSVHRSSPSKCRKKVKETNRNLQEKWVKQDKICSFDELANGLKEHLSTFKYSAIYQSCDNELLLYKINTPSNGESPFLSFSVRIFKSLELKVWLNEIRLSPIDLSWLQLQDNKLLHWSQLENLLSHLHNKQKDN